MKNFSGRVAVVTGGGTGIGRALVLALAREGARVAACDVSMSNLEETKTMAEAATPGAEILVFHADVTNESEMTSFRDTLRKEFGTEYVNLLFNNAGIGGGGSFVAGDRNEWERVFNISWQGVYIGCRTFIEMLVAADEGYIVNVSSLNGIWACIGPNNARTAYAAAKFAIRGFTEALIIDLRLNAPHVHCAVVMPGHVGTDILLNSGAILGTGTARDLSADQVAEIRTQMVAAGLPVESDTDEEIRTALYARQLAFSEEAPVTATEAVNIILEGVMNNRWRILVGEDVALVDEMVRADPERAYESSFFEDIAARGLALPG